MVATRTRAEAANLEIPKTKTPPVPVANDDGYERCRDQRIRENLERMQKLGLADLASKLKSDSQLSTPRRRIPKSPMTAQRTPRDRDSTPRRSSRLQNVSPICYNEADAHTRVKRSRISKGNLGSITEMVSKDEVYTEEHEKMLGTCEATWTLFVDGCGPNGRRIYDQIKGKTCHQCRQKTLGYHTHCSRCEIVQGQFCGDCLYMRYGENVLEAIQNTDWICPVCRGICNCSICRAKKNWAPTGALYRKIFQLGYKSVAHYLIQTRQGQAISENPGSESPILAKKELPFTDLQDPPPQSGELLLLENSILVTPPQENFVGNSLLQCKEEQSDVNEIVVGLTEEEDPNKVLNPVMKSNVMETVNIIGGNSENPDSSDSIISFKKLLTTKDKNGGNEEQDSLPTSEYVKTSPHKGIQEPNTVVGNTETQSFCPPSPQVMSEKRPVQKRGRKPKAFYVNLTPSPDSIAGRLRKRQNQA